MSNSIDRRSLLLATGGALLGAAMARTSVVAQEPATPVAILSPSADGLDLPILPIEFRTDAIEVPAEVPAGWVRVLTALDYEDFGYLIVRIPDDEVEHLDAIVELATAENAEPPAWLTSAYCPGGVRSDPRYGGVAEGFVLLEEGTYLILDFFTGQAASFVAVGANATEPAFAAAVEVAALPDMSFRGFDEPVPGGRQLWKFTNDSDTYHDIYPFRTPPGVTAEDILASVESEDENAFDGYSGGLVVTSALSPGGTLYFYLSLDPGPHAVFCTTSDNFAGPPHFFMGMIETFEVA